MRNHLSGPLVARYQEDSPKREAERPLVVAALAVYLSDEPDKLTELILSTETDREFEPFLEALRPHQSSCVAEFLALLKEPLPADAQPHVRDAEWRRRATAAVCLLEMGRQDDVWPILKTEDDPSLKSFLIDRIARLGARVDPLVRLLAKEPDPLIRQVVILALGDFDSRTMSEKQRKQVVETLTDQYVHDHNAGIHSAAVWALRRWQEDTAIAEADGKIQSLPRSGAGDARNWWVNSQRQAFIIVNVPVASESTKLDGDGKSQRPAPKRTPEMHKFSVSACEVTTNDFRKFKNDDQHVEATGPQGACPINGVSWYEAAAYCNWLSDQEGIPQEQWCYKANAEGKYAEKMTVPADCLERAGYRLPTNAEWEYFCRANSKTTYSFGESPVLLEQYAWCAENSRSRLHPVGKLKPNPLGAFDMHGNVWEWCHDSFNKKRRGGAEGGDDEKIEHNTDRALRGGSFANPHSFVGCDYRYKFLFPHNQEISVGFRLAKTIH